MFSLEGRRKGSRGTDIENEHMNTKGGRGRREMNLEIGADIYTLLMLRIE